MEDKKEAIVQNNEEDIQYTFVVPKGEVYREPEDDESEPAPAPAEKEDPVSEASEATEASGSTEAESEADTAAKTIIADRKQFYDAEEKFFEIYKAADPGCRTAFIEPPVYETGLSDVDDITYTFVVPKGEKYVEPDPEEEKAAKEAARVKNAILATETRVMERTSEGETDENKTRYGLPVNHPEMGELAQKQEERRLYKQRKKNRFRTRFYVLVTSGVLLICWLILSNSGLFTIDAIEVKGNSHYTAEEIINIGHATSGRNIIYKANIKETEEFLEQNPYIKQANVTRKLPSTLVIKVTEREEHLAFKYDDDYLVMDEEGMLLRKTRNKPKTTIVQGIVVNKIKLGEKIGAENSKRMDKALDIINTMIKSDLFFVKIDMSKENSVKAYIYDTLVVKTDYETLMTHMEDGRLHLVVEKLFKDGIKRGTISFQEDGSASFVPTF